MIKRLNQQESSTDRKVESKDVRAPRLVQKFERRFDTNVYIANKALGENNQDLLFDCFVNHERYGYPEPLFKFVRKLNVEELNVRAQQMVLDTVVKFGFGMDIVNLAKRLSPEVGSLLDVEFQKKLLKSVSERDRSISSRLLIEFCKINQRIYPFEKDVLGMFHLSLDANELASVLIKTKDLVKFPEIACRLFKYDECRASAFEKVLENGTESADVNLGDVLDSNVDLLPSFFAYPNVALVFPRTLRFIGYYSSVVQMPEYKRVVPMLPYFDEVLVRMYDEDELEDLIEKSQEPLTKFPMCFEKVIRKTDGEKKQALLKELREMKSAEVSFRLHERYTSVSNVSERFEQILKSEESPSPSVLRLLYEKSKEKGRLRDLIIDTRPELLRNGDGLLFLKDLLMDADENVLERVFLVVKNAETDSVLYGYVLNAALRLKSSRVKDLIPLVLAQDFESYYTVFYKALLQSEYLPVVIKAILEMDLESRGRSGILVEFLEYLEGTLKKTELVLYVIKTRPKVLLYHKGGMDGSPGDGLSGLYEKFPAELKEAVLKLDQVEVLQKIAVNSLRHLFTFEEFRRFCGDARDKFEGSIRSEILQLIVKELNLVSGLEKKDVDEFVALASEHRLSLDMCVFIRQALKSESYLNPQILRALLGERFSLGFYKTGSELRLARLKTSGDLMTDTFIVRSIAESCCDVWIALHDSGVIAVEPIFGVKGMLGTDGDEQRLFDRVTTGFSGNSLGIIREKFGGMIAVNKLLVTENLRQLENTLEQAEVVHGHAHWGNICINYIPEDLADGISRGEINPNTDKRVLDCISNDVFDYLESLHSGKPLKFLLRLIDFDQARFEGRGKMKL